MTAFTYFLSNIIEKTWLNERKTKSLAFILVHMPEHNAMKACRECRRKVPLILRLGTRRKWAANSRYGYFVPGKEAPGNFWLGGWMSPQSRSECPAGNRTPVLQPVASKFTDWVMPAQNMCNLFQEWRWKPMTATFLILGHHFCPRHARPFADSDNFLQAQSLSV